MLVARSVSYRTAAQSPEPGSEPTRKSLWYAITGVTMPNYADEFLFLAGSAMALTKAADELVKAIEKFPGGTFNGRLPSARAWKLKQDDVIATRRDAPKASDVNATPLNCAMVYPESIPSKDFEVTFPMNDAVYESELLLGRGLPRVGVSLHERHG